MSARILIGCADAIFLGRREAAHDGARSSISASGTIAMNTIARKASPALPVPVRQRAPAPQRLVELLRPRDRERRA